MRNRESAEPAGTVKPLMRCVMCDRELESVDPDHCPNQPYKATTLTIEGYYGGTVFDGTDITGEVLQGFLCDECLRGFKHKLTLVQRFTDRRIKPGTPEWAEFERQLNGEPE